MAALLRILDSVWCKELGRQIGRRFSPMEQTPQPKLVPWKGLEKNIYFILRAIWSENISDGHLFVHL